MGFINVKMGFINVKMGFKMVKRGLKNVERGFIWIALIEFKTGVYTCKNWA